MLNVIRFKQVQTHGDIHNVPQFLTAPFGFDQKLKEEKVPFTADCQPRSKG